MSKLSMPLSPFEEPIDEETVAALKTDLESSAAVVSALLAEAQSLEGDTLSRLHIALFEHLRALCSEKDFFDEIPLDVLTLLLQNDPEQSLEELKQRVQDELFELQKLHETFVRALASCKTMERHRAATLRENITDMEQFTTKLKQNFV